MKQYIKIINEIRVADVSKELKLHALTGVEYEASQDESIGLIEYEELRKINDLVDELWEEIDEAM